MSFGSTIKNLRTKRGLTQDQLANLLNVTPQAISRWENNAAMPDISLLVPLANIFHVSTDTLLEVNVEKEREHIEDMILHALHYIKPYGETLEEKLAIYREEVKKHPESAELKEALITILSVKTCNRNAFPDLAVFREMVDLTEDVIEHGGGSLGVDTHKSQLVHYLQILNNAERVSEIAGNAPSLKACREILLPSSLTGRAQVDARKDLIFQCLDTIINSVYSLYGENADVLTNDEWEALRNAEKVVAAVYGQSFSDHFVLLSSMYNGVRGALSRGNRDEAVIRLQAIVERLKLYEKESAVPSPLVLDKQLDTLYLAKITVYTISDDATWISEHVSRDFDFDDDPSFRDNNPLFDKLCHDLDCLKVSDGGQQKIDSMQSIERIWNRRHSKV